MGNIFLPDRCSGGGSWFRDVFCLGPAAPKNERSTPTSVQGTAKQQAAVAEVIRQIKNATNVTPQQSKTNQTNYEDNVLRSMQNITDVSLSAPDDIRQRHSNLVMLLLCRGVYFPSSLWTTQPTQYSIWYYSIVARSTILNHDSDKVQEFYTFVKKNDAIIWLSQPTFTIPVDMPIEQLFELQKQYETTPPSRRKGGARRRTRRRRTKRRRNQ